MNNNIIKFYYTEKPAIEAKKDSETMFAVDNHYINKKEGIDKIVKKFFNATYEQVQKLLETNNHIYEAYNDTQNIKFFVDIDYTIEDEETYNIQFEDGKTLLSNAKETIEDFLKKQNIDAKNPIILDATTDKKFSYHLIYDDLIFDNVKSIKNLMKSFESYTDDLYSKIIDTCVYRKGYFRCINQSKINKKNALVSTHKILDTLLLTVNKNLKVISFNDPKETKKEKETKIIK